MSPPCQKISRRDFVRRAGTAALGAAAASLACSENPSAAAEQPPNILLINADDLGMGDLSCYGGEIPTPNIDSLARQGLLFTDFYVSAPVCTPSRFSQLTGLMPQRSRHNLTTPLMPTSPQDAERGLEPGEKTIAQVLRESFYATGLIGKWHLGHGNSRFLPTRHGFDYFYGFTPGCIDFFTHRYRGEACFYRNEQFIEEEGYSTDLFTREAVAFLVRNRNRPFYLNLAHNAPHYGKANAPGAEANVLQAPEELIAGFDGPDADRNIYSAMVVSLDNGVGMVLEALERLGLSSNTLVIFTSDNGADPDYGGSNGAFRGEKATLFEGGIRVPCLMRWPSAIEPGGTCSRPCSHLDFYETFSSLGGAPESRTKTEGLDLLPLIKDPDSECAERTLFWVYNSTAAIRQGKWKYLQSDGQEGGDRRQMLFDLSEDPYEENDLAGDETSLMESLKATLDNFISVL
ncbi:MAG: sulfatase-like hydrolase/transferase [Candidatus Glassbacteria bacterium]|nr:sulfatase-like hydrolase/transferase [Candidatus Glassbacteria bacterium]